jgi:hypothetical protein
MLKIEQGLIPQQIAKDPVLVRSLIQRHQVLNITEGHHPNDPILWASILEDSKYGIVVP